MLVSTDSWFCRQGVIVLERLSSLLLDPVCTLCGGAVLSSTTPLTARQAELGALTNLSTVQFQGQWYVTLSLCSVLIVSAAEGIINCEV